MGAAAVCGIPKMKDDIEALKNDVQYIRGVLKQFEGTIEVKLQNILKKIYFIINKTLI